VLRGMEFYRGHLIAYSLGNFANFHNFDRSGQLADSAILRVRLGPRGFFRSARLVPVLLVDAGRPTRGGNALRVVRRLSKDDFGARAARLSRTGRIRPPA
jgi:poly-gamma-glutamate capsule biosynthesis protein CapA/YwtB (metallophosphatase superfamily)